VVVPTGGVAVAVCVGAVLVPPVLVAVGVDVVPVVPPDAVVVEVDVAAVPLVPVPVSSVAVELEPALAVLPLASGSVVELVPVEVPLADDVLADVPLVLPDVLDVPPARGSLLVTVPPGDEVPVAGAVDVPVKSVGAARVVVNVGTVVTTGVGVSTTGAGAGAGATAAVIDSAPSTKLTV
jgi:hypothetical protein